MLSPFELYHILVKMFIILKINGIIKIVIILGEEQLYGGKFINVKIKK
jgi:hypothetical protein